MMPDIVRSPNGQGGKVPMDENRFAMLIGRAALKIWPDLPREAQRHLFEAAIDDAVIGNSLATFLHGHHPRTAHPPKPTRLA